MLTLYLNLVSQVLFSFSDDKSGTVGFGTQTMGMARDNSTSWLGGCLPHPLIHELENFILK